MPDEEKQALFENTAHAMGNAPEEIKRRHIGNYLKADPTYGAGVAQAMEWRLLTLPGHSSRRILALRK